MFDVSTGILLDLTKNLSRSHANEVNSKQVHYIT